MKNQVAGLIYLRKELDTLIDHTITEYAVRDKDIDADGLRKSLIYHMDEQLDLLAKSKKLEIEARAINDPKLGHWICLDYKMGLYECPNCHAQGTIQTWMYKPIWNYCPLCGKKNRESKENNNKRRKKLQDRERSLF